MLSHPTFHIQLFSHGASRDAYTEANKLCEEEYAAGFELPEIA